MKIIYNITVKIDLSVHDAWLSWMSEEHIPAVMETGYFESWQIAELLRDDDPTARTYAIQYVAHDMIAFEAYQDEHSARLQADHKAKFGKHYVAFRSVLQLVDRGKYSL
jgi:hypothetical protein